MTLTARPEGSNKAVTILMILWTICLVVLAGIIHPLSFDSLFKIWLLGVTSSFVGASFGFVASRMANEGRMIAELEKSVSTSIGASITAASLTAVIIKGKDLVICLSSDLNQTQSVIALIIILFFILGFLIMYFWRLLDINPKIVEAQSYQKEIKKSYDKIIGQTIDASSPEVKKATQYIASSAGDVLDEQPDSSILRGAALINEKKYQEAIKLLDSVKKSKPLDYKVLSGLASAYSAIDDKEMAEKYVAEIDSMGLKELALGYRKLYGQVYFDVGKYSKAIEHYVQYISKHPNDQEAFFNLTRAYAKLYEEKRTDEAKDNAIDAIERLVEEWPDLKETIIRQAQGNGFFSSLKDLDEFKQIVGI